MYFTLSTISGLKISITFYIIITYFLISTLDFKRIRLTEKGVESNNLLEKGKQINVYCHTG